MPQQSDSPTPDREFHTFAWDGFSFPLPADWNMSDYHLDPKGSSARFEDDVAVRMELEWARLARPAAREQFLRHYAKMAADVEKSGARNETIEGLPPDCSAKLYAMPDKRLLVTAYGAPRGASDLQFFFRLHFDSASRREPPRLLRRMLDGFRTHTSGVTPWEVFDVAFELDSGWRLIETSFMAGRKRFTFSRHARRMGLWFCSLAHLALRGKQPAEWAADFIKTVKYLEGRRFVPAPDGRLLALRRWQYPFGHVEEIARFCFQYKARCVHDQARNRLVLAVLQYRTHRDLAAAGVLVPGLDIQPQSFFG